MTPVATDRLVVRPAAVDEARRVVAGEPLPTDHWAVDFPAGADVAGAALFLLLADVDGEQGPFGCHLVERQSDGLVVGAAGFKGRPREGAVEIWYGLVPSARGAGLSPEVVGALLALARREGVSRVVACTAAGNTASRRALAAAGFTPAGEVGDEIAHEARLDLGELTTKHIPHGV